MGEVAARWRLSVGPPFDDLGYHRVAPARRADGTDAVLKLGVPTDPGLHRQARCLELLGGEGAARLLAFDAGRGALLLERVRPGRSLAAAPGDDRAATRAAAGVMARLRRAAPAGDPAPLRPVEDLVSELEGISDDPAPLPAALVRTAALTGRALLASASDPAVLHGDLHHGNILRARREPWLAIDPEGLVGDPAFEPGALLRNPGERLAAATEAEVEALVTRRTAVLAEVLGLERHRIVRWAFVQAVLSAWWQVEDHGRGWEPAVGLARILEGLAG